MSYPRISLEQWRTLIAVVDAGSYAQAALMLNKSQSSVTYAVQKLESLLGVKAFEVRGRKAELTATGRLLYRRAQVLLSEASGLEQAASALSAGWEAEIRIAMEILFPNDIMLQALAQLGLESPHTRIELMESVLGGTSEALLQGRVDLAISPRIPTGFLGDALMSLRFIAVAHPDHALHQLGRKLTQEDLRAHRHLLVRDSGIKRESSPSLEASQRWTVSTLATSIEAACLGHGFAWFPELKIRPMLNDGRLKPLTLVEGNELFLTLYLIYAAPDLAGPGTRRLGALLKELIQAQCTGSVVGNVNQKVEP
jgi:DNA-binding transcriptional LysR family regulator